MCAGCFRFKGSFRGCLSYDVLLQAQDDSAARALATAANKVEPAALRSTLQAQMDKDEELKAKKERVGAIPKPEAAAKTKEQVSALLTTVEAAVQKEVQQAARADLTTPDTSPVTPPPLLCPPDRPLPSQRPAVLGVLFPGPAGGGGHGGSAASRCSACDGNQGAGGCRGDEEDAECRLH